MLTIYIYIYIYINHAVGSVTYFMGKDILAYAYVGFRYQGAFSSGGVFDCLQIVGLLFVAERGAGQYIIRAGDILRKHKLAREFVFFF
jgi:hypothetical protein